MADNVTLKDIENQYNGYRTPLRDVESILNDLETKIIQDTDDYRFSLSELRLVINNLAHLRDTFYNEYDILRKSIGKKED